MNAPVSGTPIPDPWAISKIQRLGKYYLMRKLAQGGMAEIFLAKQVGAEGFERNVVIKLMLEDLSRDREFVDMFQDEARLAAKLLHPNIVQIYDLGLTDGRYYICMEYLAGEDLAAIVRRCKERREFIPVPMAARIMASACEGLAFAHAYSEAGRPLNIVHRDISPSNILVTYQGTVKLVDFGIAKAESKIAKTSTGTVKGKWVYMSPEQARGSPIDCRSDIFSLGLTLFELLTCRTIFRRDNELAILRALLTERIPLASELRADIPKAMDDILAKALNRNLDERYRTCAEFADDLDKFLASTGMPVGTSHVSGYLRDHFGTLAMEQRCEVPSLKTLASKGVALPLAEERSDLAAPTVARGAAAAAEDLGATRVTAAAAVPAAGSAAPAAGARWTPLFIGAVGGALLLAAGATAAIMVTRQPPAPTPVAAVAPVVNPTPPTPTPGPVDPSPTPSPTSSASPAPTESPAVPPVAGDKTAVTTRPNKPAHLTPKDIAKVVSLSRARLLGCFESHRDALSSAEGQVAIRITIAGSGAVTEAKVATPGFESSRLTDCIVTQAKRLKFPRNLDDGVTIDIPFVFRVTK